MGIVCTDIAVSADGFAAGPHQSEAAPMGEIEDGALHAWMLQDYEGNRAEVDAILDAGATIMGRNMFGPVRGEWDRDWRGWWGDEPPYHGPVFVLTHFPHEPIRMEGGDRNISVAGGASTVNQFLAAGLLDELRLHVTSSILGAGERLFEGVPAQRMERVSVRATSLVTHLTYRPARA